MWPGFFRSRCVCSWASLIFNLVCTCFFHHLIVVVMFWVMLHSLPHLKEEEGDFNKNSDDNLANKTNGIDMERMSRDGAAYQCERSWKCSTRCATVIWWLCYSTLGFASTVDKDTFFLYTHWLGASNNLGQTTTNNRSIVCNSNNGGAFEGNTCGTFISQKMVQCTESQAVYTFVLVIDRDDRVAGNSNSTAMYHSFSGNDAHPVANGKYLLLWLLS